MTPSSASAFRRLLAGPLLFVLLATACAGETDERGRRGERSHSPRPGNGSPASPPASPAPDAPFICTMVIGFSQTGQWFRFGFETQVDDASWELFMHNGAGVSSWADPESRMWTSADLYSPCAARADDPDRVLLTISDGEYLSDASAWAERIDAAVSTIRQKFPGVEEIILQPVVGGPDGGRCSEDGVTVRATFNQPYIAAGIQQVAGGDVVAGAIPEVRSCDDYRDGIGHFKPDAKAPIGIEIGTFYRGG